MHMHEACDVCFTTSSAADICGLLELVGEVSPEVGQQSCRAPTSFTLIQSEKSFFRGPQGPHLQPHLAL